MNTVEDRLRAALRETAGEVTPRSVPPLRLHGARRRGRAGPAARRRWVAWLAPLAAAASVTAVVAASLAISTAFHGGHRAARGPAGPFAGVPPYYVALAVRKPHLESTAQGNGFVGNDADAIGHPGNKARSATLGKLSIPWGSERRRATSYRGLCPPGLNAKPVGAYAPVHPNRSSEAAARARILSIQVVSPCQHARHGLFDHIAITTIV